MNIRDPSAVERFRWDWTFLNDSFSRGIRVGDADGLVECKGRVLLLEGKHRKGSYGKGQRLLYDALVRKGIDVVIFWGDPVARPQTVERLQIYPAPIIPSTRGDLARWVAGWFWEADR